MTELPALQPGQVLQLCWETPEGAPAALFGVLREQRGAELVLGPTEAWPADLPPPTQPVELRLYASDGLHQAPARVVGTVEGEGLRLALSGLDQRFQRRRFERARLGFRPAAAALLGAAGEPALTFLARVVDLSAGGLRFICPVAVQPESRVVLRLVLEDDGPLLVTARVIRVSQDGSSSDAASGALLHAAGSEFEGLEPPERSRLFRFVRRRRSAEARAGLSAASSAAGRG